MAAAAKYRGQVVDGLPDVQGGAEAAEKDSLRFKAIMAKKKKKEKVQLGGALRYCNLETESSEQTHKLGPSHPFP